MTEDNLFDDQEPMTIEKTTEVDEPILVKSDEELVPDESEPDEELVSDESESDDESKSPGFSVNIKYTNPNVIENQKTFKPIDKTKSPWKYQLPLGIYNHTPQEVDILTQNPYYSREDATYGQQWQAAVGLVTEDDITSTFFGSSLGREGSEWAAKVPHEGQLLGPFRPKAGPSGNGEKVVGLKAVSKIQALLGLGGMAKVPLWHSGIYVAMKAPSDIQLLNFYETIAREKIELGKTTSGLIFLNSSAYVNSAIYDLAIDCIYESSLKDVSIIDLKSIIKINDFPILAWALAYSIYPNGHSYVRPCIANPEKCQHVVECIIDIGKLLWVDRTSLNEKQRKHMAGASRTQVTKEQVIAYQEEFANGKHNQYDSEDGISVVLKQPTIEEHLNAGARWIDELDGVVRDVFTDEVKQDNINRFIEERASLTKLRNFSHYIKHVIFTGDNSVSDDEETLERLLDQLSSSPEVVNGLATKLNDFIDNSAVSLVGLPRTSCPKCGAEYGEDKESHPWVIPLNPVRLFFRLRDRKLQQSIPT